MVKRLSKPYEPTSAEIRRACDRIQKTWNEKERCKRSGQRLDTTWQPPRVSMSSLTDAANEEQDDFSSVGGNSDR